MVRRAPSRSKKSKELFLNLFLLLFVFLLFFFFAEIILHFIMPLSLQDKYLLPEVSPLSVFEESSETVFQLAANASSVHIGRNYEYVVPVNINAQGLREDRLITPSSKNILFIGDSLVFGYGVLSNETISYFLEKKLREQGYDITVINAGYAGGYGPDAQYLWYKYVGRTFSPGLILYEFGGSSDFGDLCASWVYSVSGELISVHNPSFYVDSHKRMRTKMFGQPVPSAFFFFNAQLIKLRTYILLKRVMANSNIQKNFFDVSEDQIRKMSFIMGAWNAEALMHDAQFVPIVYPEFTLPENASRYQEFRKILIQRNISYVDRPGFFNDLNWSDYRIGIDGHYNAKGNELLANYFYEELERKGILVTLNDSSGEFSAR